MIILRIILILLFASTAHGATYSYYFATGGTGTTCTDSEDPCNSLSDANTKVDALGSTDVAYLYFNRGDTWTEDSWDTIGSTSTYGMKIESTDPVVHIDAYGTGAAPIFDGSVTDFSSVPAHNATTGPLKWNRFFEFKKDGCSVSNIEVKGVYGHAFYLNNAGGLTLSNVNVHDFGSCMINSNYTYGTSNNTVEHSTIHTGQQLELFGKISGWAAAIQLSGTTGTYANNHVHHNVVYDIYGECITAPNGTVEYNVVGSCGSVAIDTAPHNFDATTTIVRHNLIVYEDRAQTIYDGLSGGDKSCFRAFDETAGGDNSSGTQEFYGNICINYDRGMRIYCNAADGGCTNPLLSLDVYDNIFIDNSIQNFFLKNGAVDAVATTVSIHDNSSLLLERDDTSVHVYDESQSNYGSAWTITGNHYWDRDGSPSVDSDWDTNYIITDPELLGEDTFDWDGITGATYWLSMQPDDEINPPNTSPIYQLNTIMSWSTDEILAGEEDTSPGGDPGLSTEFTQTGTTSFTQTGTVEFTQVSAYSYLGYSNTGGTPDSPSGAWTAFGSASVDLVHVWKADTDTHNDGTAVSINIYMATVPATPVTEFVCLYKGTTLIATADSSGATGSSWNEFDLTAVSGESLAFAGSDILYFGHCLEDTDQAFGYLYHDNGNTTDPMYWNNADWVSNLPASPITLTESGSTKGMGVILKYQE